MEETYKHTINLDHLSLGYPPEEVLISDVTASVKEGEMIAIVGRNGSGKSTLLRTLAGLQKPIKGSVFIGNMPVLSLDRRKMAGLIAFVGTSVKSPENLTVFEMISLGRYPYTNWWGKLKESDKEIIFRSLSFVGMEEFYEKPVQQLSDGEKQRAMIAMALAQDAKVIILDEPTAFLDIPNRVEVADVLHKMKTSGKSIIYSTHDFETALHFADKIWLIHNQKLIEGAPEDLGLQDLYNDIFSASGMYFDTESQHFKKNGSFLKKIFISCSEGKTKIWTRMMLERIGYQIFEEQGEESIPRVEVYESGDLVWILKEEKGDTSFGSLYELALYLNN